MPADFSKNPMLDEGWLKRAAFVVTYRSILRRLAFGVVVCVEIILLFYSAYSWLDYFVLSAARDRKFATDLTRSTDVTSLHQALGPAPITVGAVVVLPGSNSGGKYDVLAKLANKNKIWAAVVTYTFSGASDTSAEPQQAFVLNDDERFVIGVGAAAAIDATPTFTITKVAWQRIRNVDQLNALKPKFVVSDATFMPPNGPAVDGKPAPSVVHFTVTNEGVANYWSVGFTVVLLNGDSPVAARYTTLEQVHSGDRRDVSINLYTTLSAVGTVLVVPDVNVLDPSSLMPVSGGSISF